jgi:2-iminobutanoate/2-iminopropanoate deaminase
MTTITPIGTYADAVAVSGGGTQIFVSGTPGLREDGTQPEGFTDEAWQCWANVENALGKVGAQLTLSTCANGSPAVTMCPPTWR